LRSRSGLFSVDTHDHAEQFLGLALQLRFWKMSESMGNHDSEVVDASSVD